MMLMIQVQIHDCYIEIPRRVAFIISLNQSNRSMSDGYLVERERRDRIAGKPA